MNAREYVLSKVDAVIRTDVNGVYHVCCPDLSLVISQGKNEEQAWLCAKEYIDSIVTLPCGVQIKDDRPLGFGLSVLRGGVRTWASIEVLREHEKEIGGCYKFYIRPVRAYLEPNDIEQYIADLEFIKQACIEANEYFGG